MLNLVMVNFPCVDVQFCLINIQIGTPHISEGLGVFFDTLKRLFCLFVGQSASLVMEK